MDEFCGRKTELDKLCRLYARAEKGESGAVLISGPAGCGKTTLATRFALDVERDGGFFVHGKADTASKRRPFATIAAALDMLVKKAIADTPGDQQGLKQAIRSVAPDTGHGLPRLLSLVPALSYLFKESRARTDGPGLGDAASANPALLSLLEAFAAVLKRPIVLFLDDLQWLGAASHGFLRYLAVNRRPDGLLMIMAHRTDDPDTRSGLGETVRLYESLASTLPLTLSGLTRRDTRRFLARRLDAHRDLTPLSDLCHEKTAGSPLHLTRLLDDLLEKGVLSRENDEWSYDITRISGLAFAENVADLIIGRITRLEKETLALVKQAACIRGEVGAALLSVTSGYPREKIETLLWKPVQQDLLRKTPEGYTFSHDKILESVMALVEGEEARRVHQRLVDFHLDAQRRGDPESDIFTLLYHYGFCRPAVTDPSYKKEMAGIYFKAGEKALGQSAYDLALDCFIQGKSHFPGDIWAEAYGLALKFCRRIARCAYLAGDFDTAEEVFEEVDANAGTFCDRMATELLKISCCQARHREEEALAAGLTMLRRLGFPIPERPSRWAILAEILKAWGRFMLTPRGRLKRRRMDPESDAAKAVHCLSALGAIAFYHSPERLMPLVIAKGFRLTLKHGNMEEASVSYIGFGMILNEITGGIKWGRRLGAMARAISREFGDDRHRVREWTMYNVFLDHWDKSIARSIHDFEAAEIFCLRQGDHEYFGYNATGALQCMIIGGTPLPEVGRRIAEKKKTLERINNRIALTTAGFMHQAVENLASGVARPWILDGAHFREARLEDGAGSLFTEFHFNKLLTAVYCGRMDKAAEIRDILDTCDKTAFDSYQYNHYRFLCALMDIRRQIEKKQIRRHLKTLKKYAARNGAIYKSKYLLVLAEDLRLRGRPKAPEVYRAAAAAAGRYGFGFEEALAMEGLSKIARDAGDEAAARQYAGRAVVILRAWGLKWKHGLFDDGGREDDMPPEPAAPDAHFPGRSGEGTGDSMPAGMPLKDQRIDDIMESLRRISGATVIHGAVKGGQAWKGLVYIDGQGIHRPQTFVSLPERMLNFSVATSEVVRADRDGAESPFFDAAYFWEKQPSSLMVVPAGKGRGVCFENPAPSLPEEEVVRSARELFSLLIPADMEEGRDAGEEIPDAAMHKRNCGKILSYMAKSRAYKNQKLTLAGFSRKAKMSQRAVTAALNICLGQNFRTFLNSYRVEAV